MLKRALVARYRIKYINKKKPAAGMKRLHRITHDRIRCIRFYYTLEKRVITEI